MGLREADLKAELTLRETQPNSSPSLALIGQVFCHTRDEAQQVFRFLLRSFQGISVRQRASSSFVSQCAVENPYGPGIF